MSNQLVRFGLKPGVTTYTPDLGPGVLDRLRDYAAQFADDFPQAKPAQWAGVYLEGLLLDGDRKSVEPPSRRVTLPAGRASRDPEQALQQFVNQSPWDEQAVLRRYRATLAQAFASPGGVFLIDDVSVPKQGGHSVGVQRQYCGALGKQANCQGAVSVHDVGPAGHFPLDLRLDLPDSWLADRPRLDKAGAPAAERRPLTKPEIALERLDRVRAEGWPGSGVVADAGYGVSRGLRDGLADRARSYVVGVTADRVVFPDRPTWIAPQPATGGRPQTRSQLADGHPPPVSVGEWAGQLKLRTVTWREGTKGQRAARFAWVRVWPGRDWRRGGCAGADPVWLWVEGQADGQLKYALSNLPAGTSCEQAVCLWKSRWPVEQGYQQLKEELGLDHCAGRSGRGFHHHTAMTCLAYGLLLLEKRVAPPAPRRRGKKGARD
jgi:SRSO17 transposase